MRTRLHLIAAMVVFTGLALTACSASGAPAMPDPPNSPQSPSTPIAAPTPPPLPTITKVLTFVIENHSRTQMMSDLPYAFGVAQKYGYATAYAAVAHPSLPNYLAISGGQTQGITADVAPSALPVKGQSVFGQAIAAGKTAGTYADAMTSNCQTASIGTYAARHNPWVYYVDERAECAKYDVPLAGLPDAISKGTLPNVGMVIPDLCNDAHDCDLSVTDAWFKNWLPKVFAGPDWKSGHLVVIITADEDYQNAPGNGVLTTVAFPGERSRVVASPLTHYSLTRLYEDVIGAPYLYNAATAPSLSQAFEFQAGTAH